MPNQGDIILIPVPFTNLSSQKRRPVIVISHDEYNRRGIDMVVVAMTSNPTLTPYSFIITNENLDQGTLNRPGTVRVDKIYTLEQTLMVKTFGRINSATLDTIQKILQVLTSISQ